MDFASKVILTSVFIWAWICIVVGWLDIVSKLTKSIRDKDWICLAVFSFIIWILVITTYLMVVVTPYTINLLTK